MPLANQTKPKKNPLKNSKSMRQHFPHRLVGLNCLLFVQVQAPRYDGLIEGGQGEQILVVEDVGAEMDCYFGVLECLVQFCADFYPVVVDVAEIYGAADAIDGQGDGLLDILIQHIQSLGPKPDKNHQSIILMLMSLNLHSQTTLQSLNRIAPTLPPQLCGCVLVYWAPASVVDQAEGIFATCAVGC